MYDYITGYTYTLDQWRDVHDVFEGTRFHQNLGEWVAKTRDGYIF